MRRCLKILCMQCGMKSVVFVLGGVFGSDGLTDKEEDDCYYQNRENENYLRNLACGLKSENGHGGKEVRGAVTPKEVVCACAGNDKAKEGEEVNNNHSDDAAKIAVITDPKSESKHCKDNENGTYNEVPADIFANKRKSTDLLRSDTGAILICRSGCKTITGKNAHLKHDDEINKKSIHAIFDFAVHKFHSSHTLLVFFIAAL